MDEEIYLKQRLALDDRVVKLLEKKVHLFLKGLYTESPESAQNQYENLLIQLANYQTNLERHPTIQQANTKDIKEYENIINRTSAIRSTTVTDIVDLKEELIKAQKSRDHKLEYDRVARDIMKLNRRQTYHESINELQTDIRLLQQEKYRKLQAIDSRKENLNRLVKELKDLQKTVEAERNEMNDEQKKVMDMERGYVSSDDEGDMGLSDNEEILEEEKPVVPTSFHRFQERNDEEDEDEEEGIVLDTPMTD
ncbi:hypothetical protein BDB01DRAFT_837489 [Pilobolus umbonatus]|nr:hypothetical protein BDB01DRAFT_837489 [Pilobolus umbonatus]